MAVDDERFRYRLLYPVCGVAVLAESHGIAGRRTLDVAELAEEPLLLLRGGFASRDWFDAACSVARIQPRVLLESAAPHTAIALARAGYGIAVVPSTVQIPREGVRAVPLVQRGVPIGRWLRIGWDPERFLAPYAERFIEELVSYCKRKHPGQELTRRAPPATAAEVAKSVIRCRRAKPLVRRCVRQRHRMRLGRRTARTLPLEPPPA